MKKKSSSGFLSKEVALEKLRKYCAYQDRCHSEVRNKLLEIEVYGDTLEEIISVLIQEKFLNEERFARSYARGKFRIKNWGRIKIKQQLKLKKVSEYCIRKGMSEIEEEDYLETLKKLLEKKLRLSRLDIADFESRIKAQKFAAGKGYEYELIQKVLNEIQSEAKE